MSEILNEVLAANEAYAAEFETRQGQTLPPTRHFAILTCMDARMDPVKIVGLKEGDAHVIRNAGGRASDDALRSLIISYTLVGTREWFVIHHTDCGMEKHTDESIISALSSNLKSSPADAAGRPASGEGTGSNQSINIDWLTIKDRHQSVIDDVQRIRTYPLVPPDITIYGYLYDVHTGRLVEVPGANAAGKPL